MKIKLKPCPKCGQKKIWQMHKQHKWHCECFSCGICQIFFCPHLGHGFNLIFITTHSPYMAVVMAAMRALCQSLNSGNLRGTNYVHGKNLRLPNQNNNRIFLCSNMLLLHTCRSGSPTKEFRLLKLSVRFSATSHLQESSLSVAVLLAENQYH